MVSSKQFESIIKLFENQAQRHPHAIALYNAQKTITYEQLNAKSNQLAHHLRSLGVQKEAIIGIHLDRGFDLFITILAILKAGAAYLPLDINSPTARLDKVIKDAQLETVITQSFFTDKFQQKVERIIKLDIDNEQIASNKKDNLNIPIEKNQLAYVIYTSGSTGEPKGVCVEHGSLVNLAKQTASICHITNDSTVLQFAPINFDISVIEWSSAFYAGAGLVLLSFKHNDAALNALLETAKQHEITVAILVSTIASLLEPKQLPHLETLIVGAEPCPSSVIQKWSKSVRLFNGYGPTEATGMASIFYCDENYPSTTIGYPINGAQFYILDKQLEEVKNGEIGELYIGGDCLARGYLNKSKLTEAFFYPHPKMPHKRLYKTGDFVRKLPNGAINFIGRKDEQIKINGHRVHLNEITKAFDDMAYVKKAFTCYYLDCFNHYKIMTFVTLENGLNHHADKDRLIQKLKMQASDILPSFMMPHKVISLEKFPMTGNGKIDQKYLLKTFSNEENSFFLKNELTVQHQIIAMLSQILQKDIQLSEIYHKSLAIDSLKLMQLASIAKDYNINFDISKLFNSKNLNDIFDSIMIEVLNENSSLTTLNENQTLPLNAAQQHLANQNLYNIDYWNQAISITIEDDNLNIDILKKTMWHLLKQHEPLNGSWSFKNMKLQRKNRHKEKPVPLFIYHLASLNTNEPQQFIKEKCKYHHQAMCLETGDLFKCLLFYDDDNFKHQLIMIAHHFIIDGLSWRILIHDFEKNYQNLLVNSNGIKYHDSHYADWVEKFHTHVIQGKYKNEIDYWSRVTALNEGLLLNSTRFDKKSRSTASVWRPDIHSNLVSFYLDKTLINNLLSDKGLFCQYNTNELLIAAFCLMLKYSTQYKQFYVMLTGHGREPFVKDVDISHELGWFTRVYPVRFNFNQSLCRAAFFDDIIEQLRNVPNKGFGFHVLNYAENQENEIIPKLSKVKHLPNVLLNYSGQWQEKINNKNWTFEGFLYENCRDPKNKYLYDLEINIELFEEHGKINLQYNPNVFSAETIVSLGDAYLSTVRSVFDIGTQNIRSN